MGSGFFLFVGPTLVQDEPSICFYRGDAESRKDLDLMDETSAASIGMKTFYAKGRRSFGFRVTLR
jgi:hypothetical protein